MSNSAPSSGAASPQAVPSASPTAAQAPTIEVENKLSITRLIFLYFLPGLLIVATAAFFIIGTRFVKTENAYTKTDIISISSQVSAPISKVLVRENQTVTEGDILYRLDDEPFLIRLQEVHAKLEDKRRDVEGLKAGYRERLTALEVAKSDAAFAGREFQRQSELVSSQVVSEARFDRARHTVDNAQKQVTLVTQDLARMLVSLGGDPDLPVAEHPAVIEATAKVDQAELDLDRTLVRATISGAASKVPNEGDYARSGFPSMSIVATDGIWIEANFKETQLTFVERGQPVVIKIDGFPGWEWDGYVDSIASATGSEFSILPAMNTSGNWVKVVQRLTVRIKVEPKGDEPLLRAGLSSHVAIDIGMRRGTFSPRKEARSMVTQTPSPVTTQ
jgi:membrane fusion protein (multidrug efflux system)